MPDLSFETAVYRPPTIRHIAGLDEAGRGALAGPVVAAAVVLPLDNPHLLTNLADVNDSKQLSAARRETLFETITHYALAFGIGQATAADIDRIGILPATKQAMQHALTQLALPADYLLIDGRIRLTTLPIPQQAIVRGDGLSLSIAAASILAKVTRDRLMVDQDTTYPHYGFATHKGYGTEFHRTAISQHGPCPIHRFTFAPIRQPMV